MLELAKTILVKQAESITIVNAVDDKDAEVKVRVTTLKSKPLLNTNLKTLYVMKTLIWNVIIL